MTVATLLVAIASLALAAIALRGRTLLAYLAFDFATWAIAFVAWNIIQPDDSYLALIAFGVFKLAVFSVVLGAGREVRWSSLHAAALAAVVYAMVLPTQMRTPIDGDEPFYLLITESLVHDHDLDLSNQYRDLAHSATGRDDLRPQEGDPVGRHGEQYSRHEPFLSLILIPGYLAAGLPGALATIALFGVLLARSTVRLLEEEGIDDRTIRWLFPFFAFAPPIVFYAVRIWPEVPGAFCFVEALRGVKQQRAKRALPALFALMMLKLRFGLIAVVLAGVVVRDRARRLKSFVRSHATQLLLLAAVPLIVVFAISGRILNVHAWRELMPYPLRLYVTGAFGLLLDGAAGLLFQAPFYLLGIYSLTRWRSMPRSLRIGALAAVPYILYLLPRSEWHGGWSPPLRYIVVFMPLLFLGAAALIDRRQPSTSGAPAATGHGSFLALSALWTMGIAIHGLAFPWRLFHIENGENPVGEWLSTMMQSDFSRLFPSFIRLNHAAIIAAIALIVVFVIARWVRAPQQVVIPLVTLAIVLGYAKGQEAGPVIDFEDAHVIHNGGELYPELYTPARFLYRSGWRLEAGDSVSFLALEGSSYLAYACASPVTIEAAGHRYRLPATGADHLVAPVTIAHSGRVSLRSIDGVINIDRMWHE